MNLHFNKKLIKKDESQIVKQIQIVQPINIGISNFSDRISRESQAPLDIRTPHFLNKEQRTLTTYRDSGLPIKK